MGKAALWIGCSLLVDLESERLNPLWALGSCAQNLEIRQPYNTLTTLAYPIVPTKP